MKAKQSRIKAEMILGRIDLSYKKQKKVDKQLIKRTRRILEKREAEAEIIEAISQQHQGIPTS